jgi:hypothetical protein
LGLRGEVAVQESEAGGTVPVPPDPPSGIGARVR